MNQVTFSEEQIQRLFGHEAAEDEDPARLREYYFKTNTYDEVAADLPLRILVGHKGIGKSALFKVAMLEDRENGIITVLIKPDDVAELATNTSDFLKTIREWKVGLSQIIAKKVLSDLGLNDDTWTAKVKQYGGTLISFFDETFRSLSKGVTQPAKQAIVDHYLKKNRISIYIDDLDRGWQGRKQDNVRISALLNAVRDLSSESRGLNFRISLRSDVYYLVRTSDESTDKIEGSVIWHSWNNHEIFVLLVKRIESFFGRTVDEQRLLGTDQPTLARYLRPVMEERFQGQGLWENAPMYRVLMSLIRKRPRDLVKLCTLAGRAARKEKSQIIGTKHFQCIFEEYSQGRLQDTVNEFRSELPSVEKLLLSMKPSKRGRTGQEGYVYTTDALLKKINAIREQGQFKFATGEAGDSKRLAAFMYKINFLTARKESPSSNVVVRKYFEENRYLSNEFVDFGFGWEIHPAYRWALQPDSLQSLFASLSLTADDE
ncbi:MAG: P-loop ATPase, Sll1717 family [Cytophagales bacterium]